MTLKYFMWGYQPHFRQSAKALAGRLFDHLDLRLSPEVFLVGFIRQAEEGWYDICLEPEHPGVTVDQFDEIKAKTAALMQTDPQAKLWHTDSSAQARSDAFVARRSLSAAVQQTLAVAHPEKTSYCSLPARVNNYDVIIVLQLNEEAVDSHFRLDTQVVDWDNKRVATSLIDACTMAFFKMCVKELERKAPGEDLLALSGDFHEALREAANILSLRVARVSRKYGSVDLFDTLNGVASMFYEKEAGQGSLLLGERGHPNVVEDIVLREPIRLSQHRGIRRLVEVATEGSSILTDGEMAYGFGHLTGNYNALREDLFEIAFSGHHRWSVRHDGKTLMRVEFGKPLSLTFALDEEELKDRLKRRLTTECNENTIITVVKTASELGHGAQVVISDRAAEEAERLSPQATAIEPVFLTEETIRKLCSVDGAILLDPSGYCHAFGLILDGVVSSNGDRNRGSRYNSAVRYSDGRSDCVIVVVSDDGMIDILPKLRPQLSRNEIASIIEQLEDVVEGEEPDEGVFNQLMSAAVKIQFYLSQEQCDRVNAAHDLFVKRRKMETGRVYVKHSRVQPDPELESSYFLE